MPNPDDQVLLNINIKNETCSKRNADRIFQMIRASIENKDKIDIHSCDITRLEICDKTKYITPE